MSPINAGVLVERLDNLAKDVEKKHSENRTDIHRLGDDMQLAVNRAFIDKTDLNKTIADNKIELLGAINKNNIEIAELATKIGIYAALGGGVAGLASALIIKVFHI